MFDLTRHPAVWSILCVCVGVGIGLTIERIHLFDVAHAQMCCSQFDVPLNQQLESEHAYGYRQDLDREWYPTPELFTADPCKR